MKNVKSATHASRALAVLALLAVPGCRSTSAEPSEPELLACVCGDPYVDLLGCTHPLCVESEGNPENPDCVCSGLSVEASGPSTQVSLGAGATNRALGELQILSLESGGRVRGTLVFDDGLSIRIRFADGNTKNYTYDELAPKSVYRLMKAKASYDDGPGQIEVGNYARDVGYYAHARRHYEAAVKADPALEDRVERELAKLRALASQQELVQAQAAYRDGRTVEAEDHLAHLLREFPDEEAADSATAMLGEIRAREAGTTRSAPDQSAEIQAALAPAQKAYARSVEANRDGLLAGSSFSKATKHFKRSVSEGEKSRKLLARVIDRNPDDRLLVQAAAALDRQVLDVVVDANVNMASVYMTRQSFNNALAAANHAIALDSKSQEARAIRARIELAASNDGFGGWRVRPVARPARR